MTLTHDKTLDMTQETINALGFVEVRGLAATIETADAMLKSAEVRLLRQLLRDPAQTMITVEGGLGACRAAVDAGQACATRLGAFIGSQVMGRPANDTADFVLSLAEAGRRPFGEMAPAAKPVPSAKPTVQAPPAPAVQPADTVPTATPGAASRTARKKVPAAAESDDSKLLEALTGLPGGYGAQALARRIGRPVEETRERLEALCAEGKLIKRRGRYVLAEFGGETR
jgi:ethanolamine utilization protein EutK